MLKKISILVLILTIFISAIFAESNSLFGEDSKFSFETKVGYSEQTLSFKIFADPSTRGSDVIQKTISIDETVKYDSGNGFDYVLSVGLRLPYNAYFLPTNIEGEQALDSDSFQKSLNLFFGIQKEVSFTNNLSIDLALGLDSLYLFKYKLFYNMPLKKSIYFYPLEIIDDSKMASFGIGGALKVNYKVLDNLKLNVGINFTYNPLVFGKLIDTVKDLADSDNYKYQVLFYTITPTIGVSYNF